ncbi:hypothetical protein Poly41_49610 [Novipirellula artificiosorum]|uniref:Uncharacterized protein n=1 Tax=Novipirellula artificiosorum TaxID=2528016 RepID=A0A5C6DE65_9BACT|nr:hypothetical protein Poly41_49610 [Novipirellula artificiosorum]
MGVDPYPCELVWSASSINLAVKQIGNGFVIELDRDRCTGLFDQFDIDDQQRVVGVADAEPANLTRSCVTKTQ